MAGGFSHSQGLESGREGEIKIAVLGGLGFKGKAALLDLSRSEAVREIISVDAAPKGLGKLAEFLDMNKVKLVELDASSQDAITSVLKRGVDVAIDLLPQPLMTNAFEAAMEAGVHLVSTNYARAFRRFDNPARAAGIAIMPECGLDPGIDLVIFGQAVREFDELHVVNSYCGGFPEKSACDNPLAYKISWNWEMVLTTQNRDSVFIKDRRRLDIPASEQHDSEMIHKIDFPGLGELEAVPNGNAVFYTDLLGVTRTIRQTGRYALRWPGWCAFWRPLKKLGFLSDEPVPGLDCAVSPHQFLAKFLEPKLRYHEKEKDLVAMLNVFEGIKDGRKKRITISLLIERDVETGLFAMSLGVGYAASIVAQMLARGQIKKKGLLSPATDVPYEAFMAELSRRGLEVNKEVAWLT